MQEDSKTLLQKILEAKLWIVLLVGIIVRLLFLDKIPGGVNQDEAFAGYEAYSILHYGIDSFGYSFPVYLVTWGAGMSALNSYLMIPFIALFGVHTWVIRMPQVIVSCISLYVFYLLMKKVANEKIAFSSLFYLAICPWHILMSRWGLDCNLAPGFLLFGLYFLVLGVENPKHMVTSALCYGLSLYTYALTWTIVPLMLLLQIGYLWYVKQWKMTIYHCIAGAILAFLALPLILFVLINWGYMSEIRTAVFSIPKMVYIRSNEISLQDISLKFMNTMKIILNQDDGLYWNSTPEWGLYYKIFGLTFGIFGLSYVITKAKKSIQDKTYNPQVFLLIQFAVAIVLGCLDYVNVNRINCIHLWIVAFSGIGLILVSEKLNELFPYAKKILYGILCVSFLLFTRFYLTEYRDNIGKIFQSGIEEAVTYAMDVSGQNPVHVAEILYPKVLLFSKLPADEYVSTVKYTNYPSAFLDVSSCGRLRFNVEPKGEPGVFITSSETATRLSDLGYDIHYFDQVAVLVK